MSRPGEKITRKTIMMQKKMKEMEQKEISSKSLFANVLDIEDDFRGKNPSYICGQYIEAMLNHPFLIEHKRGKT